MGDMTWNEEAIRKWLRAKGLVSGTKTENELVNDIRKNCGLPSLPFKIIPDQPINTSVFEEAEVICEP